MKAGELGEIISRLDWLDEERHQAAKKIAELEQRLTFQERELKGRNLRIQDLERQVANPTAQLARMPQVDTKLQQFRDETVRLIEQYDQAITLRKSRSGYAGWSMRYRCAKSLRSTRNWQTLGDSRTVSTA